MSDGSWSSVIEGYGERLDALYVQSVRIKCPFMRRRSFEAIEGLKSILQFIIARHKSAPFVPTPLSQAHHYEAKVKNLPLDAVAEKIYEDWLGHSKKQDGKGYYITGRLSEEIYREDCIFDGPDPDMPVQGLRKYLLFASQLFDRKHSRADLTAPLEFDRASGTITAYWRLEGILNLPWHPYVKPWCGRTVYTMGEDNLIARHSEQWDIHVLDAFLSTLIPGLPFGAPAAVPIDDSVDCRPIILHEENIK